MRKWQIWAIKADLGKSGEYAKNSSRVWPNNPNEMMAKSGMSTVDDFYKNDKLSEKATSAGSS